MHSYADDIQLYGFCNPSKKSELSEQISICLDATITWFSSNRLQLNLSKSELMWPVCRQRMKSFVSVRFGSQLISAVPSTKYLGVFLNSDMSFKNKHH